MTSTATYQNDVKAKRSLDMLLIDRSNEFHELASAIGYSTTYNNWEEFILRFCLEFDDCFNMWSEKYNLGDHNKIHKCMTIMRQMETQEDVSEGELLHVPIWFAQYDHKGKKIILIIDANSGNIINSIGV
jgi:hypothetical protein